MTSLDFSRAVRGIDSLLRHRHGILEFTARQDCIFRIAPDKAPYPVLLSDGTEIEEGEPVLQLHFWNEHLPAIPTAGPDPAWANRLRRAMHDSLVTVASFLERSREYDNVRALHGSTPLSSRIGVVQMIRTGQRFGFDVIEPASPLEVRERVHQVLDSLFLWSLAYAFNPAALRQKPSLLRQRHRLWISRQKLLSRYGGKEAAASSQPH